MADQQSEQAAEAREDIRDEKYEGREGDRDEKYEGREVVRDERYSMREIARDEIQVSYRRFLKKALPAFVCAGAIVAGVSGLALWDAQRIGDGQVSASHVCKQLNNFRIQSNAARRALRLSLEVIVIHLQQDVEGQTKPAVAQRLANIQSLTTEIDSIQMTSHVRCP